MLPASQTVGLLAGGLAVLGSFYCLVEAFTIQRLVRLKKVRTAVLVATGSRTKLLTLPVHKCANDNGLPVAESLGMHRIERGAKQIFAIVTWNDDTDARHLDRWLREIGAMVPSGKCHS